MPGITERQLILYAMGRWEVFEYVVGLLAREARLVPTSVKDLMLWTDSRSPPSKAHPP